MQNQANSVCIICGKVRVFSRKWADKENGKGSVIMHEETKCPDPACQQLVDEKFQAIRDHKAQIEERRQAALLEKAALKKAANLTS